MWIDSVFGCSFFTDAAENPTYAGIAREGIVLHLQWRDPTTFETGVDKLALRFVVDDVDTLFAEFSDKGVFHAQTALRNTDWGTREFAFYDLYFALYENRSLLLWYTCPEKFRTTSQGAEMGQNFSGGLYRCGKLRFSSQPHYKQQRALFLLRSVKATFWKSISPRRKQSDSSTGRSASFYARRMATSPGRRERRRCPAPL